MCARFISVSDFGMLSLGLVYGTLFALILDFSFPLKLPKDIAQNESDFLKITLSALKLKIFLLPVYLVIVLIYVFIFASTNRITVTILIVSCAFYSFFMLFIFSYRGIGAFRRDACITLTSELTVFMLVFIVAYYYEDLFLISTAIFLGRLLQLIIIIWFFQKSAKGLNFKEIECYNFNESLPYAAQLVVSTLLVYLDSLVVGYYVDKFEIGLYQAGLRLTIAFCFLMGVMNAVALPGLAKAYSINIKSEFKYTYHQYIIFAFVLGSALLILLILFPQQIVVSLFGENFISLIEYAPYIAVIVFLRYVATIQGTVLTISGNQAKRVVSLVLSMLVILFTSIILVPEYGLYGAYVSVGIGTLFLCIFYLFFSSQVISEIETIK
ncbi:MAG: oligosaccharide flippase family protein [Bacteroidia bacterium]|nr:oligosaccharide flippase family protein [Bacteroidia bacterium]